MARRTPRWVIRASYEAPCSSSGAPTPLTILGDGLRGQSREREACSASLRRSAGTPTAQRYSQAGASSQTRAGVQALKQSSAVAEYHSNPGLLRCSAPQKVEADPGLASGRARRAHLPSAALLAKWIGV
jgi:hypothetical protein